MRISSFEHIVRLQFNSLMPIIIKNKLKSRYRQLARRSKLEVLFCEIAETKQVERGTNDTYLDVYKRQDILFSLRFQQYFQRYHLERGELLVLYWEVYLPYNSKSYL